MDGKDPVCPSHPNLSTTVYETEEALREYIRLYVRIPLVSRIGVLAQTLDFVADAAPGVKEILAIGKVCYGYVRTITTSSLSMPRVRVTSRANSPHRERSARWPRSACCANKPIG